VAWGPTSRRRLQLKYLSPCHRHREHLEPEVTLSYLRDANLTEAGRVWSLIKRRKKTTTTTAELLILLACDICIIICCWFFLCALHRLLISAWIICREFPRSHWRIPELLGTFVCLVLRFQRGLYNYTFLWLLSAILMSLCWAVCLGNRKVRMLPHMIKSLWVWLLVMLLSNMWLLLGWVTLC